MTIQVPTQPILSIGQFERLSNIFDNAGQVALGALVFAQFTHGFDNANMFVLVLGAGIVILCWVMSLSLAKKGSIYEI